MNNQTRVDAYATPGVQQTVRILHSVGHLSRGGIENWLYDVVRRLDPARYEHHVMVWTREQEAFTAQFAEAGVTIHALPDHLNPVLFAWRLLRLLRESGPFDVLHTHGTQFHGFVMLVARLAGLRFAIAHSHTDIRPVLRNAGLAYRAYAWAGHLAIRSLATTGLGVSELAARSMFGRGWRADPRWRLLYCGTNLDPFASDPDPALRAALQIPEGSRVIGHVGRFEVQKNHAFLVEIIAVACRLDPTIHFLLIGDGSLHAKCVESMRLRDLVARVTFIRDCRTVPLYMISVMDGFVLPSLFEGLALVAVEAQAAGLACILSDNVSDEAIVIPDRTRALSLDLGPENWAQALLSLPPRLDSRKPRVRTEMVAAGFDIADTVKQLARVYDRMGPASRPDAKTSRDLTTGWDAPDSASLAPVIFIAHPSDLLTDHLPNGDGLIAYGFISELLRRGYRLHIAARGVALRIKLPSNGSIHEIPRRFRNELLDRLHYMLAIRRTLWRLRQTERIDLVHQMNPVFAGLSLGLLGCGLPIVLGTYVGRWPGGEEGDHGRSAIRLKALAVGRALINALHQSQAAALLVTTPAAMNRIPLARVSQRKCRVVRHGIDASKFRPNPGWKQDAATRTPTILFYSHLDRRKGVFVLVDAFRIVMQTMPEARLRIVGRGDHGRELGEHIASSGCADRVEMRGRIDREEAPAVLCDCSVYCLPSFGEPYGTTLLEAMACARPVVVTDAGGLPYMMAKNGGLRVPAGDATALAHALIAILSSTDDQVAMGAANRAAIEADYSWDKVVDDLETVYRQVAATVRSGSGG